MRIASMISTRRLVGRRGLRWLCMAALGLVALWVTILVICSREQVISLAEPLTFDNLAKCRIALFDRAERLSRASNQYPHNRLLIPWLKTLADNPLVMNAEYANLEVTNMSEHDIVVFKRPLDAPGVVFG